MPTITRAQEAQAKANPLPIRDVTVSERGDEEDNDVDGQDEADAVVPPQSVRSHRSDLSRRDDEEFDFLNEEIVRLKDQLSDMKAERNLELLQEEERKSEFEQKKAELFEERHKCAFGDPNLLDIDKKIDSINGTLEVIRSASTRKGIEYERAYAKGATRLEQLERKLQREIASDGSSRRRSSIVSSIPEDKRVDVIKRWNKRQEEARKKSSDDQKNLELAQQLLEPQNRLKQEEADRKVAEALQAEIDQDDQEREKLQRARDEKRNRLTVPFKVRNQEVKPSVDSLSTPIDKDQMLTAMFARQGSARELSHFNGDPVLWIRFKNQFEQTTEQCKYSNSENLWRLEKSLGGEALRCVKNLMTVPDNVPVIMKRLEKSFGNSTTIVRNALSKLKQSPAVKEGRPDLLVEFGHAVMDLTAVLTSLGEKDHLANPIIVEELVEKLPYDAKWAWRRFIVNKKETLQIFTNWIEDEIEIARGLCKPKTFDEQDRRDG